MSDTGIDNLVIKVNADAEGASKGIDALIGSLTRLESITSRLTATNSALKRLGDSFKYINRNANELNLTSARKNLVSLSNSLTKTESGTKRTITGFKLMSEGGKSVTYSVKEMGDSVRQSIDNIKTTDETVKKTSKSFDSLGKSIRTSSKLFNLGAMVRIGKTIAGVFSTSIKAANDYVESQNLFLVAMGEYADEATRWSNEVSDALGIDPAEMQKNMGYFQQLSTALGVASDQAYVLTKNMTSLAYDISSLYNIGIDQSFLKLQSAIVGELEPIRRLGIDISKARLQQELYDLGIRQNVETLSQADKAILRYIAIMKQTKNAQADMGKTLMSPANALRVLKSSFIQLSRSVGYIFIPILQTLLPVVQLVTRALAELAEKLAIFLGYEAPKFDTTGLGDASDDFNALGGEIDDTAAKIKSFTTGFDELNVISNDTSGLGGAAGSILGGIELPEYDILAKYAGNLTNEVLPKLMKAFEAFGESPGVQLALKILRALFDSIKDFGQWILENPETFGTFLGNLALALGAFAGFKIIDGVVTSFKTLFDFLSGDRFIKIAGWVMLVVGSLLTLNGVVNLASGEFESLGKTAKTILLGIGTLLLGVGAVFKLAIPAIIGGVVILVTTYWEELQSFLSRVSATAINGVSFIAAGILLIFEGIISSVKMVVKMIWNSFDWVGSLVVDIFTSMAENAKLAFLKLKKNFLEMINSIIQNEHVQAFTEFLDNTFHTDLATKLKASIDTSEVDKAIKDIEIKQAIRSGNLYGPFQPGQEPQVLTERARAEREFGKIFEEYKNDLGSDVETFETILLKVDKFTSGLVDFWDDKAAEKQKAGMGSTFEIDDDMWSTIGESFVGLKESAEEQLNKLLETGEINTKQLNTQELQLSEAKFANELSEADAVVTSKTLEAATETNTKLSNLWWKLDAVQKACENIRIEVYNTYVTGGGADEYAAGGLPSKGDLFIANEAGPEFVGSIGSQTAVANSDQMVAAFAQGVYQGMMAARRDGGSQKIQVPVSVLLPNGRALATATAEGQIDNGYDMGLGGFDV